MRLLPLLAVIGLALGWPSTSSAQTGQPAPTNMAQRVTEARKATAALMRQYSWTSRTEVIDQGQVKDLRLDKVTYGPDGRGGRARQATERAGSEFDYNRNN